MPRGDLLYLGHMLDVAAQAIGKLHEKSRDEYDEDENLRLAVTHLVQMIGERIYRLLSAAVGRNRGGLRASVACSKA
jgi:uncharacterized protein with HEPN domain